MNSVNKMPVNELLHA